MNLQKNGTTNDYLLGNCEWNDGTRSDLVLEPKSGHSNLPPIILEIQHTGNLAFMKMAVNYRIQASNRYDIDPVILIICVESSIKTYISAIVMKKMHPT
ncbi:hypothetical protein INT47_011872 [Mucor saturninus]|uniref:Uncharacterized protein n=1 Tax=Mucor saturninus TaxID=64648 RepID=A0A8H7RB77_9FUNG|nr:hypothetical protein INT47_011872 [Mucor saturninus]